MGCLGTDADSTYVPFLREKLVEVVAAAQAAMRAGPRRFAVAKRAEFTALRQWIRRPDRLAEDPFGNMTVRANMHAGRNGPFRNREAELLVFQAYFFSNRALGAGTTLVITDAHKALAINTEKFLSCF